MALALVPTFTPSGYGFLAVPPAQPSNAKVPVTVPTVAGAGAAAVALPTGSTPATVLIQNEGPEAAVVLITAAAASPTGTAAQGATVIAVSSATGIALGQLVLGAGIQQGAFVTAINGTNVTINLPTTASLSTTALNFVAPPTIGGGQMVAPMPAPPTALAYVSSGFLSAICTNNQSKARLYISVGV